jgi:hypothetical protein
MMQKIRSILKIGNSGASLCDIYGAAAGVSLELMASTACLLEFELHIPASGEDARLPDYPADELKNYTCYCALDFSCTNRDDPPLLIFSGISVKTDENGRTVFSVPMPNGCGSVVSDALKGQSRLELFCELGGFDGEGNPVFAWQFPVTVRSRVYLGNGNESVPEDPVYFTAVQIQAIAAESERKIENISPDTDELPVIDAGNFFTGQNVEDVLQEIGSQLAGMDEILGGI